MLINCLPDVTDIFNRDGTCSKSKLVDGRHVVDVSPETFRSLIMGQNGKHWADLNEGGEVWEYLKAGAHY